MLSIWQISARVCGNIYKSPGAGGSTTILFLSLGYKSIYTVSIYINYSNGFSVCYKFVQAS